MGREAVIRVEISGRSEEAKVLLEATELILRAPVSRRLPISGITDVAVDGVALRLTYEGEPIVLHLGERAARSWATAITTPPPTLRHKLGLSGAAKAMLAGAPSAPGEHGDPDAPGGPELQEATQGSLTTDRAAADMIIAHVTGPDDLRAALDLLSEGPPIPLWAVYPKGGAVAFGDAAIREALRGRGLRDTKACAVSATLTATRYVPARP